MIASSITETYRWRRGLRSVDRLCSVIAFDPGETTGYCAMSTTPDDLLCPSTGLEKSIKFQTGQIDCRNENVGVADMLDVWGHWPKAVVVHKDFIVDMNKIDQARHTLSPVRVTAKFEFGAYLQGLDCER